MPTICKQPLSHIHPNYCSLMPQAYVQLFLVDLLSALS